MALKPLHIAKTLEELNKKVPNDRVKSSTPRVLCRLAEKVLLRARDEVLSGDEEQAYVLYMRFIDIFQCIRSSKTYKTEKRELDKILSPGKASKALDEAERLSRSLKERYATLSSPSTKIPRLDNGSVHDTVQEDQVVPSSPKGPRHSEKEGSQPLLPLGDSTVMSSNQGIVPRIKSRELYSHLMSSSDQVLVLDCRTRADYNASHPDGKKFPQWISVPEETVRNGITDQSVSSFLTPSGRKLWKERAKKKWLVLVDDQEDSESTSPVMALWDALMKWNTSTALSHEPCILEGGYAMWHLSYAVTCVGVYKKKPPLEPSAKGTKQVVPSNGATPSSLDYPQFPTMRESPHVDTPPNNKDSSQWSTSVDQSQDQSTASIASSAIATTHSISELVTGDGRVNTELVTGDRNTHVTPTQPHNIPPQQQPNTYAAMPGGNVGPPFPVDGGTYVPGVSGYPPMMPPYTLLPPPSTAIPIALTLEGESELLTPSLSDDLPRVTVLDDDQYVDNPVPSPQLNGEHVHMATYTQPQEPIPNVNTAMAGPPVADVHHAPPTQHNYNQPQPIHQNVSPAIQHQPGLPPQQPFSQHQPGLPPQHQPGLPPQPLSSQHQPGLPPQPPSFQHQPGIPPQHQPGLPPQLPSSQHQPGLPPQQPSFQHQPPQPPSLNQAQPQNVWHHQQPPQTHVPSGQGQQNWYTVAPSGGGDMPQSHGPAPVQQPSEIHPDSSAPVIMTNRVVNGPLSDPPSYDLARQLPTHPPVPSPMPPPVSLAQEQVPAQPIHPQQIGPHPQNQFVQFPQQPLPYQPQGAVYQPVVPNPEIAERDAKIAQLMKLLEERERDTQSKASEEEEKRRQHDNEKRELNELKENLKNQLNQFEQAKQQQQEANQKDIQNLRQQLEEERTQMIKAVQQERQNLEVAKTHHLQDLQRRENETKQIKEQYERQIVEIQKQNTAMQQLEERRKQEHLFSLRQGLPQGWEKRLDSTTGRFYYVDHNSKTTHWNPPTSWLDYQAEMQRQQQEKNRVAQLSQQQEALNARLRAQQQQYGRGPPPDKGPASVPVPPAGGSEGPKPVIQPGSDKGHSVPPVGAPAQSPSQDISATKSMPSIDRSTKPSGQPGGMPLIPDRSTKPVPVKRVIMTPAIQKQKSVNLQPVFGSGCYALTGLRNLGNTCYMNSTLQCLGCTTSVIRHFTTSTYERDINYMNPLGKEGEVAIEFAWLMKAMWGGQYKSVSPRDFKGMIDKFVPQMRGNNQQDSQEFLAFLMDGLHEDLNKVKKRQYSIDVDNSKLSDGEAARLAWLNHKKQNDSIIVDFFQGLFRSTVVCNSCKKRSVNFEPFMFLTLPIPPGGQSYKLEDCIRLFSAQEKVSRSCSSCNHSVAFKRMEIWKLPPILLINIKRFTFEGQWREKRQNYIDYPVREPLTMSQYVVGEQPRTYQFYAVSNHFGSLAGGHYTACCRNPYKKTFYNFDDHEVREAQPRQIKSSAAYILFYTSLDLTPSKTMF